MVAKKLLETPNDEWKPRFYTKPKTCYTSGDDVIDFAENLLVVREGKTEYQGKLIKLQDWQKWLYKAIHELDEYGKRRYRIVLIGIPRKNGKTTLLAINVLFELIYGYQNGQIYSAATDRETAKIVWDEVVGQISINPVLSEVIKVQRDKIIVPATGTKYKALSSDASKNQGQNPSFTVFDEVHAVGGLNGKNTRGDEMWAALTQGMASREQPMLVAITTAGGNKDTLLGELFDYGVKVSNGEIEDDTFGFFWWSADEYDDPTDPAVWKKANPNLQAGIMEEDDFKAAVARSNATGFNSFLRYRLNMWTKVGVENFINPHQWLECERQDGIKNGEDVYLGFDGSLNEDATGLVAINKAGTMKVLAVWEPNRQPDGYVIPRDEVKAAIEEAFNNYNVIKLWADPTHFEDMLKELANKYRNKVERIPNSPSRIAPMARQFIEDIIYKEIGHTGEEALTRHVLNAVATESGSYKKEKPKSPNKIDLLACAVMANGARHANKNKNTEVRRIQVF